MEDTAPVLYAPGRPEDARIGILGELSLVPLLLAVVAGGHLLGGLFLLVVYPRLARRAPSEPRRSRVWFAVRMVAIAVAFVSGALSFLDPDASPGEDFPLWLLAYGVIFIAVLTPVMVVLAIRLSAVVTGPGGKWRKPTHSSAPLSVSNPLLFLHFVGHLAPAVGLGTVVTSPAVGLRQFLWGASVLAFGFGALAGVRLGQRLCPEKMAAEGGGTPTGQP